MKHAHKYRSLCIVKSYLNTLSSVYCQYLSLTKGKQTFLAELFRPRSKQSLPSLRAVSASQKDAACTQSVWESLGYATGNGMLLISLWVDGCLVELMCFSLKLVT